MVFEGWRGKGGSDVVMELDFPSGVGEVGVCDVFFNLRGYFMGLL